MAEMHQGAAVFIKSKSQMEQSTMKIKEMTPEQRREYNRVQKQQQRDREREEAAAKRIPNANDFEMPEAKQKLLDQHSSDILKTVRAELPDHKFATQDEYVVEATAHVLFGLENNVVQKVVNPHGMLVGGHYPDAVASTAIAHVHRFATLLDSATFKTMYEKLLRAVVAWDGKYQHRFSSPDLMGDIRSELDGTYVLKTPAASVAALPPSSVKPTDTTPSDEQLERKMLERRRAQQTLNGVPLQARRFLEHGP
jgi:hypothetical protein